MKRKILPLLFCMALVVLLIPAALAVDPTDPIELNGKVGGYWADESEKTIEIKSLKGLEAVAALVSGDGYTANSLENWTVVLMNDIGDKIHSLTTPIGSWALARPFKGIFDGAGHTIMLNINLPSTSGVGLIGYSSGSASIKNVTVAGTVKGVSFVGGLCGHSEGITIENSANRATVENDGAHTGGLCGGGKDITIKNSNNSGAVKGESNVGGLCGDMNGSPSIIENSYNSGAVKGSDVQVGGLCGYYQSNNNPGNMLAATIRNSYNIGTVESIGKDVGGLCGRMVGSWPIIENCYNRGTVESSGKDVGGLCGYLGAYLPIIENSYNSGAVKGSGENVGGLCGIFDSSSSITIENSYYNKDNAGDATQAVGGNDTLGIGSGLSTVECTDGTLLGLLNGYRAKQGKESEWNKWYTGKDKYPCFEEYVPAPIIRPTKKSPHPIEIAHVENGTVTRSVTSAKVNAEVTFTVTPEPGFEVAKVYVTDRYSDVILLKNLGNGEYSFKMPDVAVTIYAEFAPIDAPIEDEPIIKPEPVFDDVTKGDYFAGAVDWAVEKGITNGLSATAFGPDEACTRAQAVTFLWRMAGEPEVELSDKFTDVEAGSYYEMAVSWAIENGITLGTSETTFSPDMICNRGHIVTFLYRYADGVTESTKNPFSDVKADEYYENPVLWAVEKEITTGKTATRFAPDDDCTRGQIVTFMWRLAAK